DDNETLDNFIDSQDSDSNNDYDYVASESDDISTDEHVSEESDSSNSDIDQGDVATDTQPQILEKAGVVWSINPNPVQGRISA
ncbi:unnamed protein product, partial [Didymodactylos carnosus]